MLLQELLGQRESAGIYRAISAACDAPRLFRPLTSPCLTRKSLLFNLRYDVSNIQPVILPKLQLGEPRRR